MIPNLLHPTPITLQQLVRGAAPQDPDYREPVQAPSYAAPLVVPGQVKWKTSHGLRLERGGTVDDSDGYVLFRTVDLRAAGVTTLHINDRILQFGVDDNAVQRQVYITRLEPLGHYPDAGGATLVKAHFKDRQPSRGT